MKHSFLLFTLIGITSLLFSCGEQTISHLEFKSIPLGINITEFIDSLHAMGYVECNPEDHYYPKYLENGGMLKKSDSNDQVFLIGKYANHEALLSVYSSDYIGNRVYKLKLCFTSLEQPDAKALSNAIKEKYNVEPEYNHSTRPGLFAGEVIRNDSYTFNLESGTIRVNYDSQDGLFLHFDDKQSSQEYDMSLVRSAQKKRADEEKATQKKQNAESKSIGKDI